MRDFIVRKPWASLIGVGSVVFLLAACGGDSAQRAVADAKAALQRNDLSAARIQLKNALDKRPDLAEARFLFGQLMLQSGDGAAAEIELRKALELKYPQDEVAPVLAKSMLATLQPKKVIDEFGQARLSDPERQADLSASVATAYSLTDQREKADALVNAALSSRPESSPLIVVQARIIGAGGDIDRAMKLVDEVIGREPSNADALRLQGDLLLYGKKDKVAAQRAYQKVLETYKEDVYVYSQLIDALLQQNDVKAASERFEVISKLRPKNQQVVFLGARIALAKNEPARAKELINLLLKANRETPPVLLMAAAAEFRLGSLSQAENHLNKLLASNPGSAPAREMLASVHVRGGQPEKALTALQSLLESGSPSSTALTLAAEAHLAAGNTKSAETFFGRVLKAKPDDVRARTALALAQIAKGDREEAIGKLQSIASSDPGTLADMALIDVRLRKRDYDGAIAAIDALDRKVPDRAMPQDLRGRTFLAKFDIANARASFERAISRDPAYFPSIAMLAAMDTADRKYGAAASRFEALLKTDPKNSRAILALAKVKREELATPGEIAQLLSRAIEAQPGDPTAHMLLVEHWLRNGNAKSAVSAAQAGLAAIADSSLLLDALGRAQMANGEVAQALATFGKLALREPKSPDVLMRVAEAQVRAKNIDAAEKALTKALEIAPEFLAAQAGLINLAVQGKQPEKALRVTRTIQTQRPKQAIGYLLEGDVQFAVKNLDAAIQAYRAGLAKQGSGLAAVRVHQALAAASRRADADRFAEDWVKQNPKDAMLRLHLARKALSDNNLSQAEALYREVVKLEPDNLPALNNLAWTLAKEKKPEATEIAERAVALSPADANSLDTLAFVLGEVGQFSRGIDVAKSAIRQAPEYPHFRLTIARLYIRANDKTNAKAELDKLAELGTKFSRQSEVAELQKLL